MEKNVLNKLREQGDFNKKALWTRYDNLTEKCQNHTKIFRRTGKK